MRACALSAPIYKALSVNYFRKESCLWNIPYPKAISAISASDGYQAEDVSAIKKRMQEIIAEDIPFRRTECHTTEAVRVFCERGMNDKVKLLETSGSLYTYYYTLGDTVDYYCLVTCYPAQSFIKLFDIVKYYDGLCCIPNKENPTVLEEVVKQEKMLDVFRTPALELYHGIKQHVGDFNLRRRACHRFD